MGFLLVLVLASVVSVPLFVSVRLDASPRSLSSTAAVPDFSVQCCFSTGDGTVQVTAGQTYSSWGWVYSLNNFAGTVSLSLNVPFPPSSITSSETVAAGATVEPGITISPPSSTAAGTYTGSMTGTSGSLTHTIPVSIVVSPAPPPLQGLVCFSRTATSCPSSPAQFTAPLGGVFTAYVVVQGVQALNGFNIWFQYPYGLLNATGVSLQGSILPGAKVQFECVNGQGSSSCGYWLGNGPGIVALYATGNQTIAPTTGLLYSVTFKVTGSGSGGFGFFCVTSPSGPWMENCASVFNGSSSLSVNVQGATFNTGPGSGTQIPFQQTIGFGSATADLSGGFALNSTARTLTGSVSATVTNSTNGQMMLSKTFVIAMTFGSNPSFKFVLLIPVSRLPLGAVCSVNSSSDQVSCFLVRDPDMSSSARVNIIDVSIVFGDFGAAQGSTRYDPAADLDGNGTVDIVDVSIVAGAFGAPVFS